MTINDLYAQAMVALTDTTKKYNDLAQKFNALVEENTKLKEEAEKSAPKKKTK